MPCLKVLRYCDVKFECKVLCKYWYGHYKLEVYAKCNLKLSHALSFCELRRHRKCALLAVTTVTEMHTSWLSHAFSCHRNIQQYCHLLFIGHCNYLIIIVCYLWVRKCQIVLTCGMHCIYRSYASSTWYEWYPYIGQ